MKDIDNANCLMPSELLGIPELYGQEDLGMAAIAYVKIFAPGSWTWFVTEYCPETRVCFGLVVGHCAELGYFSLAELEEVRSSGIGLERDLHFEPTKLSELGLDDSPGF